MADAAIETNSVTAAGQLTRGGFRTRKFDKGYFEEAAIKEALAPFLEDGPFLEMSAATRKRTATVGGDRFPMPDRKHAELALELLPKAKHLSPGERDKIKARAHAILDNKEQPGAMK